jgi:hypothetical protein
MYSSKEVGARVHRVVGSALVIAALAACSSSPTGNDRYPGPISSLLVTNGTCSNGHCDSLQVTAYPQEQPITPGGPWYISLGWVTGPHACVQIPASAHFYVVTVPARSSKDTITTSWSSMDALYLGTLKPGENAFIADASTPGFVPGSSAGWQITLPGASPPSPAVACMP